MEQRYKFVHFGCWNNLNTAKNKMLGNMKKVIGDVQNYVKNETPDFLVIAGDNYYPEKVKPTLDEMKKKFIHKNKLIEGFEILPKDIEINMILGNHDLETNGEEKKLFEKAENGDEVVESNCLIIKEEMKFKNKIDIVLFKEKRLGSTLLLMIDTSMYCDDVSEYLPCYNIFLGENIDTTKTLIERQEKFIKQAIQRNPNIKNLIIVGHHPIIGIKIKESKEPKKKEQKESKKSKKGLVILNDMPVFTDILKMIKREVNNKETKFHYLCADLHLFQKGIVTIDKDKESEMIINQYIVGTGGTELDDKIPDEYLNTDYVREFDSVHYHMSECKHAFGFLECTTGPVFNFLEVKNSKQSKSRGGSKKFKRRTKKNNISKN